MASRSVARLPIAVAWCLLLVSAARAGVEIEVERRGDALIVRSPISQGNFLFRAPGALERMDDPPEGFLAGFATKAGGARARLLLRIEQPGPDEARRTLAELARARAPFLRDLEQPGEPKLEGRGNRLLARLRGRLQEREVERCALLVRDGTRLYLLVADVSPPGAAPAAALEKALDGFTILDPKGAGVPAAPTAGDLKPRMIEHDYYRLRVFKPGGFAEQPVDPDADKGIFLFLRREDAERNLGYIRIRVHLTRALKEPLETIAGRRLQRFESDYDKVKKPLRLKRLHLGGAKLAYRVRMVGKQRRTGVPVVEEWRFIEHENGRTYEVQVTLFGAAERAWRKDLAAFWKKFRIENR